MKKFYLLIITALLFIASANAQYNKIVAKDGTGDYTTVQASIDAAPANSTTPWVILVKNGKYYEKINIPSNKPNIQLIGESVANVMVYYDDYAGKSVTGSGTLGTQNSASVTINGSDFVAINVTFANTFNYDSAAAAGVTGSQAVAVVINADRVAFKNCRFIGMQDTLYTKGSGNPRHYFYKCYIDGIVDFIFGSSIDIFDSCVIYPKARTGTGNSYITAANTTIGQAYGYLFKDCVIPANTGATLYYLGRPWNNASGGVTANNKVAFFNTKMSNSINPLGWTIWDAGTDTTKINYAEFQSKKMDGSLADISHRVSWSKQLSTIDTAGYNILNMFNGWNPCSVRADFCTSPTTEIAVSNFKGIKVASNANFSWNISWAMAGISYELYKSIDNKATFNLLSTSVATNDTTINFNGTDAVPPAGSTYYYFVKASLAGLNSSFTDTIPISSTPTINTTVNSLTNFLQGSTAPSAAQTYIVSGVNLLNDITITAPANFEISTDNITWNINPITLTQTAGSIANTTVYVRLNAASAGNYSGKIINQTNGAGAIYTDTVAVNGTTQSTPLLVFNTLQQWNLITNNADSAAVRSTGLLATTPTLNRLTLSNGTQVAAVPAYSVAFGQAVAPSSTGDGKWTTATGGNGGNLSRTLYEQFTIKPDANYSVRIDSLVALIGYYSSVSNTKIAVVYSKSNFTTDSADVTGGKDPSGATLAGTANGSYTTPVVVTSTVGSSLISQYAFALNAGNGVQINAGETLTIRIYFSCGSTSAGRYVMLKNVQVKGLTPINLPVKITNYDLRFTNEHRVLNSWTTASEINTSHFNVQRSMDGKDFKTVGTIAAKGFGDYSFTDNQLPITNEQLTLYYRLEIVDKDGSKTYSEIRNVELGIRNLAINVYPNPVQLGSRITIDCKGAKEIVITDYTGRVVYIDKTNRTSYIINLKSFLAGTYFVRMIVKGETLVSKFVVEK